MVDLAGRMTVMMIHVTSLRSGGASQSRSASVGACVPMYATRQVLAVSVWRVGVVVVGEIEIEGWGKQAK